MKLRTDHLPLSAYLLPPQNACTSFSQDSLVVGLQQLQHTLLCSFSIFLENRLSLVAIVTASWHTPLP